MVPEETQESTDCLPNPQSKSNTSQLDVTVMVASTNGEAASTELPLNAEQTLVTEEDNRRSNDANAILDRVMLQEFTFPFPDPSSTLDIQGSTNSHQSSCLSPSSTEQLTTSRAASSGVVQPPNISNGGSADTSLPNNPTGQNSQIPQIPFPFFSNPYDYELERLRREEESLKKSFEETTSELMAELERKMAEARNEYDKKSQEVDAAYNAKVMEEEAKKSLIDMNNLLASAYMYKSTDTSDLASLRAKISLQQQQQGGVQSNTQMNPTAPPPPPPPPSILIPEGGSLSDTHMDSTTSPRSSLTATESAPFPNPSGRLSHPTTSQTSQISQEASVQSNTHMALAEASILSPRSSSTSSQPRQISQQASVVQSNTLTASTALSRPSVAAPEALSVHTPRSNTPQARPPPVISNLTPASSSPAGSSPLVAHGVVRAPAPHLQPFRASRTPNSAATATATTTTYPRSLVQEQQQGRNANGGLVYLSDDE